jgi:hypothetical protein
VEHIFAKDEIYQRAFDDYPNRGESLLGIARSRASYKVCLALSQIGRALRPKTDRRRDLSNFGNTIHDVFDQFLLKTDITV